MTEKPVTVDQHSERDAGGGPEVTSEVGGLNEDATSRVFARAESSLERCFRDRAKQVELLSGTVKFFVVVGQDGRAEKVLVEESDLGDRDAEICMCEVLQGQSWPKPVGGRTAHARYTAASFELLEPDVREPVQIPEDAAESAVAKLSRAADKCRGVGSASVIATAYIDTSGAVITAGVATSEPGLSEALDCFVEVVKTATFPSPGSYPGKLSFGL